MQIKEKIIRVAFLTLVLQLGLAHVIQHDLRAFDHVHEAHFDFAERAALPDAHHPHEEDRHSGENCLLADVPPAKIAAAPALHALLSLPQHDVPPTSTRHVTLKYAKAAPRAPPTLL